MKEKTPEEFNIADSVHSSMNEINKVNYDNLKHLVSAQKEVEEIQEEYVDDFCDENEEEIS